MLSEPFSDIHLAINNVLVGIFRHFDSCRFLQRVLLELDLIYSIYVKHAVLSWASLISPTDLQLLKCVRKFVDS